MQTEVLPISKVRIILFQRHVYDKQMQSSTISIFLYHSTATSQSEENPCLLIRYASEI